VVPRSYTSFMDVRAVRPDEWRELRDIRLRALADSPDAFGATLAEGLADPDAAWQLRADRPDGLAVVAVDEAGRFVGMASGGPAPDEVDIAAIYGMWVDPAARGRRVGESLIGAIAGWAREAGFETIGLGVTLGNEPAIALYERLGFVDTGLRYPLRDGTDLTIQVMTTRLDDLAAYFTP
jgi:ribosomal protein S18 acetylase RimI-like enzyme